MCVGRYAIKHKRVRLSAISPQDVVLGALLSPAPPLCFGAAASALASASAASRVKRKLDDAAMDGEAGEEAAAAIEAAGGNGQPASKKCATM